MDGNIAVTSYVDDLFGYLDSFETNSDQFDDAAFIQTYNGICAVFQALRKQRDQAIEVDRHFLEKSRKAPLTSSDLRQLTIQVLITFFESEADIDGQSDQAYSYCRGVRAVKQDVPFFENHLLPLLFAEGSLANNRRLSQFFLKEIARYFNTFGKPLNAGLTPEAFNAMTLPMKFLELARRRLQLGKALVSDRASLEFHLQRVDAFGKMAQGSPLADHILTGWDYLVKADFWGKVKAWFSELGQKISGAFSSSKYFRLVLTQRNGAWLFYGAAIVIFAWLAVYVPLMWSDHEETRYEQIQERVDRLQKSGGR